MEFEEGSDDLSDESEPDWKSVVLNVGVWACFTKVDSVSIAVERADERAVWGHVSQIAAGV